MSLFATGNFALHSGAKTNWKIDVGALSDADIAALAEMIRQIIGPFGSVEGVPRGGLRLAAALQPHVQLSGRHLIVDDVLTTGRSMEEARQRYDGGRVPPEGTVRGAVIFARGQCPHWVRSLFQMPEELWMRPRVR